MLCPVCHSDAVLPDHDLCRDCEAEVRGQNILDELDADAYEPTDPKNPNFIGAVHNLYDNRDRFAA